VALDSVLSTPVIPPPPKGTSPAAGSSSGSGSSGDSSSTSTSSTSGSGSAQAADNSSGSASGSATKSSGKGSTASRGAKPSSQAQSASSGSKAQQGNATHQTQATAASGAQGAATQNKNPGPNFIQALAQTQANAQDSATATAAAAPQEVTGSKPKGAKDDHTDTTGTAVGFLSQSLAAAMAGLQSTNPGQNLAANTTADNDSADAVSLAGGGSTTIQSVVANIAQGAAEELAHGSSRLTDGKADTPSAASATDNSAAAANVFQAHMAGRAQSAANVDALSNKVTTPVGDTGFAGEVGDKITWMANQGVQSASLQVTPEHLGPVEVRISMQDGSASVTFNAAHADTRAALEQALPRLREMFSTQGLTLTDASVSQQSPRGQPSRQNAIGAIRGVSGDDSTSSVATVTRVPLGLVDTYV
jgi:flagellar hook-length control protein FliK